MTDIALRPQTTLMHIIWLVTVIAVTGVDFVCRCQVALFARRNSMQTKQWKAGHVMLETYLPGPAVFVMTFLTVITYLSPVDIIRTMAAGTFDGELFLVNYGDSIHRLVSAP